MKQTICPIRTGAINPSNPKEKNDCTVRALANVTDKTYEECYSVLKAAGRDDGKPCGPSVFDPVYFAFGCKQAYVLGTTNGAKWYRKTYPEYKHIKGMTVKTLLENLQERKGKYIALTDGHALAIVDGFIVDKSNNPANKRVIALYRF